MGLFSTTHIHKGRTEYVPYEKTVSITEKKAPTDESIRILNEMEEKATQNIIAKIKIESNNINAVALYFRDEFIQNRVAFRIKFILNGKTHDIVDYIDNFEWRDELSKSWFGFGHEGIFNLFHKKLSEIIASELMSQSPDFIKLIEKKI